MTVVKSTLPGPESPGTGQTQLGNLKANPHVATPRPDIDIIDIRPYGRELSIKDEILSSLRPGNGPKSMPTLLLYDERGLQAFEDVRYRSIHHV